MKLKDKDPRYNLELTRMSLSSVNFLFIQTPGSVNPKIMQPDGL